MSSLNVARLAVQQVLQGIPDFPVFHYVSDSAPPPCGWIEPDTIDYLQTMKSSSAEYRLIVTIVTGRVNEAAAQDDLDKFIAPDGAQSVPGIIQADPTLGAAVDYCVPVAMSRYGTFTMGQIEYIGAQITLEVRL